MSHFPMEVLLLINVPDVTKLAINYIIDYFKLATSPFIQHIILRVIPLVYSHQGNKLSFIKLYRNTYIICLLVIHYLSYSSLLTTLIQSCIHPKVNAHLHWWRNRLWTIHSLKATGTKVLRYVRSNISGFWCHGNLHNHFRVMEMQYFNNHRRIGVSYIHKILYNILKQKYYITCTLPIHWQRKLIYFTVSLRVVV